MGHDRMPAEDKGKGAKAGPGQPVPVQIVDQPADARCALHPLNERHQFVIAHVVGNQRRDDKIRLPAQRLGTAAMVGDAQRRIGGRGGDRRRTRVEIDAGQFGVQPAPLQPAGDGAQHVTMAEADIEQGEPNAAGQLPAQPGDGGPACQRYRVDPCQIGDDGGIGGGIKPVGIHHLRQIGALGEI